MLPNQALQDLRCIITTAETHYFEETGYGSPAHVIEIILGYISMHLCLLRK